MNEKQCECSGATARLNLCGCEIAAIVTILNAWMQHPRTLANMSPEFNVLRLRAAAATVKLCDAGEELAEEVLTDEWPSDIHA